MPKLQYIPLPFFTDNYAWLISDGEFAVVVDPGDARPVIEYCQLHDVTLTGVLLTHHHSDHVGGVPELVAWSGKNSLKVYGPDTSGIQSITDSVMHGALIQFAKPALEMAVIEVPGHTLDHLAYFQAAESNDEPHLFSGDTLFASGCGRIFEGTGEQMFSSLEALSKLPLTTKVHCAHEYTLANVRFGLCVEPGNEVISEWKEHVCYLRERGMPTLPTSIGHELAVNPFLRLHSPEIRHSLINQFNVPIPDRKTAFVLLRAWKDMFVEVPEKA